MEERELKNNYVFTLIKLILFLIILCFLTEISRAFWEAIKLKEGYLSDTLILSIISLFGFYVFFSDLNNFYKRIQNFFFRSSFFSYLVPSLIAVLGVGYFFLPKIFNFDFNKQIFTFFGGFCLTGHLVFIARDTKGHNFNTFSNYLFTFSILYILNLLIFILYLKVAYPLNIGGIVSEGIRGGAHLIQKIFTQAFQ